jgi:D-arabinose 1-dehydrogenase-like Zn-dependent alcohol dehydrogenase
MPSHRLAKSNVSHESGPSQQTPLTKVVDAYDQMISGRAHFRVVLTMA